MGEAHFTHISTLLTHTQYLLQAEILSRNYIHFSTFNIYYCSYIWQRLEVRVPTEEAKIQLIRG
jgi:hypothetical protein